LDNKLRKWFQNPQKILSPYIKAGMKALDVGCGPGPNSIFFPHTVDTLLRDGRLSAWEFPATGPYDVLHQIQEASASNLLVLAMVFGAIRSAEAGRRVDIVM